MSEFRIRNKKSIQQKQAEIRELIQNFTWETDPKWNLKLLQIDTEIKDYWNNYLQRDSNNKSLKK